eukprot:7377613-Prymnesium_polylepis.1
MCRVKLGCTRGPDGRSAQAGVDAKRNEEYQREALAGGRRARARSNGNQPYLSACRVRRRARRARRSTTQTHASIARVRWWCKRASQGVVTVSAWRGQHDAACIASAEIARDATQSCAGTQQQGDCGGARTASGQATVEAMPTAGT